MPKFTIRAAQSSDADGIAAVLSALVEAGKRSKRSDAAFALSHYIGHPNRILCSVAVEKDGQVLGFQSLKTALAGNAYGTPLGWGIIGTHIHPGAARSGVGRAPFEDTLKDARSLGVPAIEAFIGASNVEGQAYYKAMGFRDYRSAEGAMCKMIEVR